MPPKTNQMNETRNTHMDFEQVYFWTDTIHQWKRLLTPDKYKEIIVQSWRTLVERRKIAVYAYVIMPNHLHVVWEMLEPNGKEMPHASFNKFTSHQLLTDLKTHHPQVLSHFKVDDKERQYRIWQRDALAICMDNVLKVEQKITYSHNNPLQEHWNLAVSPEAYHWSSARYYETGNDEWGFVTHYKERFG